MTPKERARRAGFCLFASIRLGETDLGRCGPELHKKFVRRISDELRRDGANAEKLFAEFQREVEEVREHEDAIGLSAYERILDLSDQSLLELYDDYERRMRAVVPRASKYFGLDRGGKPLEHIGEMVAGKVA